MGTSKMANRLSCVLLISVSLLLSASQNPSQASFFGELSPRNPTFLKGHPREVYEGQLGQQLVIYCLSANFNHLIACRGQHIRSGRDFLCESGTERPYKTGRRFIIESLSVADLGVYQCGTFGLLYPVINTNFTITTGSLFSQNAPRSHYVGVYGSPFRFHCGIEAYMSSQVSCSITHLNSSRNMSCELSSANAPLRRSFLIPNLTAETTGLYQCCAMSIFGTVHMKTFAIIGQQGVAPSNVVLRSGPYSGLEPGLLIHEQLQTADVILLRVGANTEAGIHREIRCQAEADLRPLVSKVEWSVVHSDANISPGIYQITSDSTGSSLVIDPAAVKDGQQFICLVANSLGHAASTVTVHHEEAVSVSVMESYTNSSSSVTTFAMKVAVAAIPMGEYKFRVKVRKMRICSGWRVPELFQRSSQQKKEQRDAKPGFEPLQVVSGSRN